MNMHILSLMNACQCINDETQLMEYYYYYYYYFVGMHVGA
jgi:hypothetical protein